MASFNQFGFNTMGAVETELMVGRDKIKELRQRIFLWVGLSVMREAEKRLWLTSANGMEIKNILIWAKGLLSRRTRKLLLAQQCGSYNRHEHEHVADKDWITSSHPILNGLGGPPVSYSLPVSSLWMLDLGDNRCPYEKDCGGKMKAIMTEDFMKWYSKMFLIISQCLQWSLVTNIWWLKEVAVDSSRYKVIDNK